MHKHRLERVLVVNKNFELRGLITVKDILKSTEHPNACKDRLGRLRVGAAIGVGEGTEERAAAAGRGGRGRDRRGHRARPLEERAEPRALGEAALSEDPGDRRQRRHRDGREGARGSRRGRRSRSASDRARSARPASWPAWACRRSRRSRTWRAASRRPMCRSSPTAASAIRATSRRRSPPARTW